MHTQPESCKIMEEEKSPIHSTSVSIGIISGSKNARPVTAAKPSTLLVFGDFGYRSNTVQKVSAAQWSDFFQANTFEITCSVENNLPEYVKPFYLEYTVESINDFSLQSVVDKTANLSHFKRALLTAEQLKAKRISRSDAFTQIESLQLPTGLKNKIFTGLALTPTRDRPSGNPHQIDSILSMMDIPGGAQAEPPTKTDNFIDAITSLDSNTPDFEKVNTLLSSILTSTAEAIRKTARFAELATSWTSLKNLLKIAGRDQSIQIFCASFPREDASEILPELLSNLSDELVPDLILWSYNYSFSTAALQELEQVAIAADKYKSLLCTSLHKDDQINNELFSSQPARIIMEQEAMIPYNRFRNSAAARSCVLCAAPAYKNTAINDFTLASGAWVITAQWINSIVEAATPFCWPRRIQSINGFGITEKIDDSRIEEVGEYGITIAENSEYLHSVRPVSVLNISERSPYRSAGFNMLVNRTARLTAMWVSSGSGTDNQDAALQLKDFLVTNLKPYHILSTDKALSVEIANKVATIDFDSEYSIDDYAIYFQFSINL
jgi:predicted component of type VI protein secretion system